MFCFDKNGTRKLSAAAFISRYPVTLHPGKQNAFSLQFGDAVSSPSTTDGRGDQMLIYVEVRVEPKLTKAADVFFTLWDNANQHLYTEVRAKNIIKVQPQPEFHIEAIDTSGLNEALVKHYEKIQKRDQDAASHQVIPPLEAPAAPAAGSRPHDLRPAEDSKNRKRMEEAEKEQVRLALEVEKLKKEKAAEARKRKEAEDKASQEHERADKLEGKLEHAKKAKKAKPKQSSSESSSSEEEKLIVKKESKRSRALRSQYAPSAEDKKPQVIVQLQMKRSRSRSSESSSRSTSESSSQERQVIVVPRSRHGRHHSSHGHHHQRSKHHKKPRKHH